jgi:hypothetical protein
MDNKSTPIKLKNLHLKPIINKHNATNINPETVGNRGKKTKLTAPRAILNHHLSMNKLLLSEYSTATTGIYLPNHDEYETIHAPMLKIDYLACPSVSFVNTYLILIKLPT